MIEAADGRGYLRLIPFELNVMYLYLATKRSQKWKQRVEENENSDVGLWENEFV
jgi:hypothetical protein